MNYSWSGSQSTTSVLGNQQPTHKSSLPMLNRPIVLVHQSGSITYVQTFSNPQSVSHSRSVFFFVCW